VPSARVVNRLEEVEDGEPGLAAGREPAAGSLVEQFALQGGVHALGEGVEAVRDAAHAGQRDVPAQLTLKLMGRTPRHYRSGCVLKTSTTPTT